MKMSINVALPTGASTKLSALENTMLPISAMVSFHVSKLTSLPISTGNVRLPISAHIKLPTAISGIPHTADNKWRVSANISLPISAFTKLPTTSTVAFHVSTHVTLPNRDILEKGTPVHGTAVGAGISPMVHLVGRADLTTPHKIAKQSAPHFTLPAFFSGSSDAAAATDTKGASSSKKRSADNIHGSGGGPVKK